MFFSVFQSLRPRDIRIILISLRANFKVETWWRTFLPFFTRGHQPILGGVAGVSGEGGKHGEGRVAGEAGVDGVGGIGGEAGAGGGAWTAGVKPWLRALPPSTGGHGCWFISQLWQITTTSFTSVSSETSLCWLFFSMS